ncbi:MAG: cell division protein FtsL [Variovorax sp.]|nr:MAG: cell division protein FtsL [Variovorax sp.]
MVRLNVLLLIAVLASALYLVHTEYRSRLLFTELDRLTTEGRRLEVDGERLQVEKQAQATPLRVEKLAKEQLKMRTTTPAITQYVRQDGTVIPPIPQAVPAPPAGARPAATATRRAG